MNEDVVGPVQEALSKHQHVLTLIGLTLENRKIGEDRHINSISKDTNFHHRTVKKALEQIFYTQNFIPKIDLFYDENGRTRFQVIDLPNYLTDCLEPEESVLLKLFNMEAWYGNKVPYEKVWKNWIELLNIIENFNGLVNVDHDNGLMELTSEGSDKSFDIMEDLSHLRNLAMRNLKEGSEMLREIKKDIVKTMSVLDVTNRTCNIYNALTISDLKKVKKWNKLRNELNEAISCIERVKKEIDKKSVVHDLMHEVFTP